MGDRYNRWRLFVAVRAVLALTVGAAAGALAPAAATASVPMWEMVALDLLPGGTFASAQFINDRGVIVGTSGSDAVRWDRDGRVTALETPPSTTSFVVPTGLNDHGEVSGMVDPTVGVTHAVRWDADGRVTELPSLAGHGSTTATGIADDGSLVGTSLSQDGVHTHAVRWEPDGQIVELGMLPDGTNSYAYACNDRGEVIGLSETTSGERHAVRWDRQGRITDLGVNNTARAINDRGVVAGSLNSEFSPDFRPVRWDPWGRVTIGEFPANTTAFAYGINNHSTMIGSTYMGESHALRWNRAGRMTILAVPTGGYGRPFAINDRDEVVGTATYGQPTYVHATHWDRHGTLTDLGVLPGFRDSLALNINGRGDIVGYSSDNVNGQAVLWRVGRR